MRREGLMLLGWRDLPIIDSSDLGAAVRSVEPHHAQLFVGLGPAADPTEL